MRLTSSFRILFFIILGFVVAAITAAGQTQNDLLIRSKDGSITSAQRAVVGLGRIAGRDTASGLFRVVVSKNSNLAHCKRALLKTGLVDLAISADQMHVDRYSLQAVNDHIAYLKQIERQHSNGKKESEEEVGESKSDWWDAYAYWLNDHADRTGTLDPTPYRVGLQHRAGMAPAVLPTNRQSRLATGTWSFVGPKNLSTPYQIYFGQPPINGRVTAIAVNPQNHSIIYIAGADGGVWKTTDGGVSWAPLSDKWTYMQVGALAIDPNNPNIIYAGTGDGQSADFIYSNGIMKSTDAGATWTNYGAAAFGHTGIGGICIDPTNSQIVLAACGRLDSHNVPGIMRSTDGGLTWATASGSKVAWLDTVDVSAPDANGNRTFWAAGEGAGQVVIKSSDHGATWTRLTSLPNDGMDYHYAMYLACSKVDPNTVYVLDQDTTDRYLGQPQSRSHIWKTINGGTSWTDVIAGFPNGPAADAYYNWSQCSYDFYLKTSTATVNGVTKDAVYVGLITCSMSPDGGASWLDISKTYQTDVNGNGIGLAHADQHSFTVDPTDPNTVFIGNDGGVFRVVYAPSSKTWTVTSLNKNLGISQFYHIAVHPTDATRFFGGLQDNAGPASLGDPLNWKNIGAGDGGFAAYDAFNPLYAFIGNQHGSIRRTTDGWATETKITPNYGNETVAFVAPFTVANSNGTGPGLLYAGTNHLWSYDPATNSWNPDIGNLTLSWDAAQPVRSIATCPSDNNRLYTGSNDGRLLFTTDLGTSWYEADPGTNPTTGAKGFDAPIVAISPLPTAGNDVLIALTTTNLNLYGGSHLLRCANTNAAAPVWTSVAGSGTSGLPNVPVYAIVRDPWAPSTVWYVGTDLGVFMTQTAGATWTNMTQPLGLPNVAVYDLKVSQGTGYLYAGTFGRGMWRIRIEDPAAVKVSTVVITTANKTVVGGSNATARVTLSTPAPYGGVSVGLSSSNTAAAQVQATAAIGNGATFVDVPITTSAVTTNQTATITASYHGTASDVLTVTSNGGTTGTFKVNAPASVIGGNSFNATVTLASPAPAGGATVALSSNSTYLVPPASTTVSAGQTTSGNFTVTTKTVTTPVSVALKATYGTTTATAVVSVKPAVWLSGVNSVNSGTSFKQTVYLGAPAPAGGANVTFASTSTAMVPPTSVTIPQNGTYAVITVNTTAVPNKIAPLLKATYNAVTSSKAITLIPPVQVSCPTPVVGGVTVTGTATLAVAAPAGGATVNLSANNPLLTLPASVVVAAGATSKTFAVTVKPSATQTSVYLQGTYGGVTNQFKVTILPTLTVTAPATVVSGNSFTGTVTLGSPATPAGGAVVTLSSGNAAVHLPANVTVPNGQKTATFNATTTAVTANTNVQLSATYGGATAHCTLTLTPGTTGNGITLTMPSIMGPNKAYTTCTVTISGANPNGTLIDVTSTDDVNGKYVIYPGYLFIDAGKNSTTFEVDTYPFTTNGSVTFTATIDGTTTSTTKAVTMSTTAKQKR
jgi:hypothetical protein